jgi:hypothetical protein
MDPMAWPRERLMRTIIRVAVVVTLCCEVACTGQPTPGSPPKESPSAAAVSGALPPGSVGLNCSGPIGVVSSPTAPQNNVLGVVGLDTTSTLQVSRTAGTDPHRLFAKTGLLVRAGREANLTVPAGWTTLVSIAWGNHAAEWTTSLHIPACPVPPSGPGQWLAFPGGFSLDKAACVPLEVRTGSKTTTVHVSAGARCRG